LVKAVQKGQPIKAVTYHHLEIVEKDGRYQATIFFDV
jgi:SHS2 domain-containing protein